MSKDAATNGTSTDEGGTAAKPDQGFFRYDLPAWDLQSITVHIPSANVLVEDSIRHFAAAKAAVQAQTKGVKHHE